MKLLLFARWRTDSPGGPDAVVLNLARAFVSLGHEVTVWSPNKRISELSTPRIEDGVTVVELPIFARLPLLKRVTRAWIASQSGEFDAALFFSVFTPLNILAARLLRCPYAAVPLGGYARESLRRRSPIRKRIFLALCERAFLERAAFVNVWSRNEQEDVRAIARIGRCVITPPGFNPIPMPAREPRRERAGRSLLFLGRFAIQHKGLDRLVDSFGRVAGPNDTLTLAGADFRGGLDELRARVAASPARDRIVIEGVAWGEAKYALFQRHDVFLHLSRWEGMPLAVVEALAFGLPVLISEATNAGEYVTAHDAGWVVVDDDFDSGVRQALAASATALDEKGVHARHLVAAEFRWSSAAEKLAGSFS